MSTNAGTITCHFITHWGVPSDIRPTAARGIERFAILEFAPNGPRTTWRYATNGMSSYAQSRPDYPLTVLTELYVSTKEMAPWIDDLLSVIASYPLDCSTYLTEGDTIDVGAPVDQMTSCFTGIMLAAPDPLTLGLVAGLPTDVLVHRVVGLVPAEIEFAEINGGQMLWQELGKLPDFPLDDERRSTV